MRTRIITIITLLLSTPMIIAQKSMDEIDRESFAAKLSPMEVKGIQMTVFNQILDSCTSPRIQLHLIKDYN